MPMEKTTQTFASKAIKPPEMIRNMFDAVAERYDLVNRMLTLGLDRGWRELAANSTKADAASVVLDACTGTGDLAFAIHDATRSKVIGVDFSKDMLDKAKVKATKGGVAEDVTFALASVDDLPYGDNEFDAVTVGFGLRNTPDYRAVLQEFYRVTKPGGRLVCLEFSQPENVLLQIAYKQHLSVIVPCVGRIVSNNYRAYKYLVDSIQVFPPQKELAEIMGNVGWTNVTYKNLLFGVVAIHIAVKGNT